MLPFPQPSLNTKSWFAIIDRLCSGEQAGNRRRAKLGVERIEDRITQEDPAGFGVSILPASIGAAQKGS
jgi:hypothetical protein